MKALQNSTIYQITTAMALIAFVGSEINSARIQIRYSNLETGMSEVVGENADLKKELKSTTDFSDRCLVKNNELHAVNDGLQKKFKEQQPTIILCKWVLNAEINAIKERK